MTFETNGTAPPGSTSYARPPTSAAAGDTIPFLLDDEYHLFHLASPSNTVHFPSRVRCSWLRQRSKNLLTWKRDSDPVIPPGPSKDDPDGSGAWTGSAVLGPDGNLHIFYTGFNHPKGGVQVILHAKSSDREGSKFEKPLGPIRLEPSSHLDMYESTDFRDPYVFYNEQESCFWMLVATRFSEGPYTSRGCVAMLTSPDLETWCVEKEPLYAPNNIFCPECPEMFTLGNGKWYLAYSRFSGPHAGTLYVVGESPRGPFRSPRDGSGGRFDGRRWYAAKSCPKAGDSSKRIAFAWVHDFNKDDAKWLWGGSFTQPREISARPDGSLVMNPAPEFLSALQETTLNQNSPADKEINAPSTTAVEHLPLPASGTGRTQSLSFNITQADAKSFGLLLNFDDDLRGYRISFEPVAGDVFSVALITDNPPLDDFWGMLTGIETPKLVDGPELVKHGAIRLSNGPLRLVLHDDIVEFFVDGKVITYRLLARESDGSNKVFPVGLFVEDGKVQFQGLTFSETK